MLASFVIYFHSRRLDNLRQTLRSLENMDREVVLASELVLVCNDSCELLVTPFRHTTQVSLGLVRYNKPILNNHGVGLARSEFLVLLDSDRVLPQGYFGRALDLLKPGRAITTTCLYQLLAEADDQVVWSSGCPMRPDFRSTINAMHSKNALSGNTVMLRSDYLAAGGMDESFEGYGYADNDFTRTLSERGVEFLFLDELEQHLYHPREDYKSFRQQNLANGIRYCQKWRLRPGGPLRELADDLGVDIDAALGRQRVKML